jgi:diadenylate cyclase
VNAITSYLHHLRDTFGYRDVVEFLLIGLVVYVVYRFLRGTRGARAVRGFILLLLVAFIIVQFLAGVLQLDRVQIIYNSLLQTAILAAVVIFQPELRRALIQLGQNRLFRPFLRKQGLAFTEILTAAVQQMSRHKIGAIIAIERDTTLLGLVETGTILNAELSADLLLTIFWPGSALHDMGAIIRQDRVVAAGCEFPLTVNPPLGSKYGARHRAALGLSEESDAVVIIVSEETGEISIAENGRFIENIAPDRFRDQLAQLLVGQAGGAAVASALGLTKAPGVDNGSEGAKE